LKISEKAAQALLNYNICSLIFFKTLFSSENVQYIPTMELSKLFSAYWFRQLCVQNLLIW